MSSNNLADPKIQLLILGASNLARAQFGLNRYFKKSFPNYLISTSIASGPGRAYSVSGGIFGLNYLPLKTSPILRVCQENSSNYNLTVALICDIGNDIVYGVPIQKILKDLEKSISNLSDFCSYIFAVPIPCKKIKILTPWQFNILKRILFPKCALSAEKIIASIQTINKSLSEINNPKYTFLKTMDDCIGWDKIHYDISKMHVAWNQIFDEITQKLSIKSDKNMDRKLMFRSFINHWKNLVFCEIIPLFSKDTQNY